MGRLEHSTKRSTDQAGVLSAVILRQKYFSLLLLLLFNSISLSTIASAEESLSPQSLKIIETAVFEVVVPKPTKDSLQYKDPLPFNNLPFAIRNDQYYSIGTAFAIGPNMFVSAAHVMSLGVESQWETPMLRDRNGAVHPIDQIVKYSERRDFIVFTLKDCTVATPFETNSSPKINQRVFAVGNALGEGVVIRDGLYTSDTSEQEEGTWKWVRFSAAASPGNSGGPLLDSTGRVIGIILRKSPNENLNVALPISEVMHARVNMAHLHGKTKYSLPIMARYKGSSSDGYLALPKTLQDLNRTIVEYNNKTYYSDAKNYFSEVQEQLFPNGSGSKALLASPPSALFPSLARMKDDGYWELQSVTTTRVDLGQNGGIVYGDLGDSLVFSLHKPDNINLNQLYTDGKLFMDLVLRGIRLSRNVGESPIRITSFGSPVESYKFRDYYGRTWLVRTWLREYDDRKLVTFSLPTPDGLITLMRIGQTGVVDSFHIPTLKILTNFIFISYSGSLKEWEEFLHHKDILPDSISSLNISRHDTGVSFSSSKLSMTINNEVIPTSDKSLLVLMMGYGFDSDTIAWDIASFIFVDDKSADSFMTINRHLKPEQELNEEFHKFWETITARKFPYNRTSYNVDGATRIITIVESTENKEPAILHSVLFTKKGVVNQDAMVDKLDNILQGLKIKETGFTTDRKKFIEKKVLLPYTV